MRPDFRFGIWERLGVIAFVASLAGVAVSVAYPLAYPESAISVETWRIVLWGSIIVLAASVLFFVCDLVVYLLLKRGVKLGTALASIGTALIIIGALVGLIGAFTIDHPSTAHPTQNTAPDVTLRFIYPDRPALLLINDSGKLAQQIKWSVALWNLDDPRTFSNNPHASDAHEPLPIPVQTFDFIRPHSTGGPQTILGFPISNYIHPGNRLVGSASVVCPDCKRGHTYAVYMVIDTGGWFAEVETSKDGELVIPGKLNIPTVLEYAKTIEAIPVVNRITITAP